MDDGEDGETDDGSSTEKNNLIDLKHINTMQKDISINYVNGQS
jgi:hypothetical protein